MGNDALTTRPRPSGAERDPFDNDRHAAAWAINKGRQSIRGAALRTSDSEQLVELVEAVLGPDEGAHPDGGWPEFEVRLRFLVRSDDLAVVEEQARKLFTSTEWQEIGLV